jgi:hypothetical protein
MRRLLAVLVALVTGASAARAQTTTPAGVTRQLERLRTGESIADLPPADSVAPGPRTIPTGTTVHGTVVAQGPLTVAGRVEGSAVSLSGDVTVLSGAVVTGDALSVGGRILANGGSVLGEMRSVSSLPAILPNVAAAAARTPAQRTLDSIRMVAATFCVLLIVAVGVLLFAAPNLDEVVATIEGRFARSFCVGLLGQVLVLPGLVLLIVALAVSIIGILLIPFAIVAYGIAVAGLVTLGFLAIARLIGGVVRSSAESSPRTRALVALATGTALFFALWLVAAALTWSPLAATIVRAAALAATWVAITIGLGAAILSRAGTHRKIAGGTRPVELASWQTPTPLTGVVAARRPLAAREGR